MRGEDTWRCPPDGWLVLGLMSGTSVDGLDVAMTRVQATHKGGHARSPESYQWDVKLEAFTTLDYPSELRSSLWGAMELPAEELAALDWHWSRWSCIGKQSVSFGLGPLQTTLRDLPRRLDLV